MGRTEEGTRQPLVLKALEGILIQIPLGTANLILKGLEKIQNRAARWTIVLILGGISVGCAIGFHWIRYGLRFVIETSPWDPAWRVGLKLGLFYLLYLVILLPIFLPVAYFSAAEKERLLKDTSKRREPNARQMRRSRLQSNFFKSYLGESFFTGKSIYLTNDQRLMHTEVVGSTGTGKSESVLLTLLAHDIAHHKGAVVIDGKGDLELLDRIHYIVNRTGRRDDFLFFSLAHPAKSNTYNPLLRGNPTELKDKIVGSMVWNEDFYRRMAEQAALTLLNVLKSRRRADGSEEPVRFSELHKYLTDYEALKALHNVTQGLELKEDIKKMMDKFDQNHKFLSGLIADLYLTTRSEFSRLVDVQAPEIDLLDVYKRNKIVYFQLNLQGYGDTAKRMGRMILQDIRTVSSYIQSQMRESKRHFFPVFLDDASSFLDLNFIDFLNKARAAGFAITLLHQSLGDLIIRGDTSFQQQVIENTNIKIILRQDDPISVEKLTKIGGTRRTLISTYQTEDKFLGKGLTGVGSIREGQAFRIDPDQIRALKRGEAMVIWKSPGFYTDFIKLDYFGCPGFRGEFEPVHATKSEKKKEDQPANQQQNKSDDIDNPKSEKVEGKTEVSAPNNEEKEVDPLSWIDSIEKKKMRIK